MSWIVSYIFGKKSIDRLDSPLPCDPEEIEIFTFEKFKNLKKEDLISFQENGIYFCFDRKSLQEWIFTKEKRVNPLTRNNLSEETLERLKIGMAPEQYTMIATVIFTTPNDEDSLCEISDLDIYDF